MAGKTVTIRLLLDLIRPQAGRADVLGLDSRRDPVAIHRQTGYLPGEFALDPRLTGRQLLTYFADLRGGVEWSFVEDLTRRLELNLEQRFGEYSRGNKQKVGLIQSFMHRPALLILDEPTSGLDPLHQQTVHDLVRQAHDEGATVFFSSHILSEVEDLCERVGFIREGGLVQVAAVHQLPGMQAFKVEANLAEQPPTKAFASIPGVTDVEIDGKTMKCLVRGDMDPLIQALAPYHPHRFISEEPSLNKVFLQMYESSEAGERSRGVREIAIPDCPRRMFRSVLLATLS